MPNVKNTNVKTMDAVLDQQTYPTSTDGMLSYDTPFEGTENALPSSETNPVFGADGSLPVQKISKINGFSGTNEG